MTNPSINSRQQSQTALQAQSVDYLPALFLVAALWFMPTGADSGTLNNLSIVFVSIVLEAIPFMFVSALVGGLIEAFVRRERMASFLPQRSWMTVCLAAGAGIVFPVCERAVVPVVRRLVGKGVPLSAAIGYLLGGPIVNPIVAGSTALAYSFSWPIAGLRLALGYGVAVVVGLLMGRLFSRDTAVKTQNYRFDEGPIACGCAQHRLAPAQLNTANEKHIDYTPIAVRVQTAACACDGSSGNMKDDWIGKIGSALHHALEDFLSVGHYLVIGAFIAALAQTYIERSSFLALAGVPALSVVIMMALAILLNLCSEADAFIAASFRGLMPVSAQMAFMLIGPMFDLKLLLMYQGVFGAGPSLPWQRLSCYWFWAFASVLNGLTGCCHEVTGSIPQALAAPCRIRHMGLGTDPSDCHPTLYGFS
jgi:uncharacterized protein